VAKVFLGFDLSLTHTGVGVNKDGMRHGYAIKPKSSLRGVPRLIWILQRIEEEIEQHPHGSIRGIAIEGYAMNAKSRQFSLGELGGVTKMAILRRHLPTAIVPPKTLKMLITGNGNASKDEMIAMVNVEFGFELKDDNIADAIGLSRVAEMKFDTGPALTGISTKHIKSISELELLPISRVRSRG
jgi:Holliday junction resolvasome RuvABC endonuclease subunit